MYRYVSDNVKSGPQKNDWKLGFCVSLLWALVLVPGKHIAWAAMQTTYSASCSNGTAELESKRKNKINKINNFVYFVYLSPYQSSKAGPAMM